MRDYPNPFIEQRADPFILRHSDGYYYFTASVPEYDRLELRRARSLDELPQATARVVWRKPQQGPMSALIWAPELHFIDGKWYLYFAAAHSPDIADGLFQHRMFALECSAANPLTGEWVEKGRVYSHIDSFSLDATHFEHRGKHYYLWAQKDPAISGNSNLYLAEMEKRNIAKAKVIYDFLDSSKLFKGAVAPEDRSLMNIPFVTESAELDAEVVAATKAAGYDNLKGHKSVGGLRASVYNAMPIEGAQALVEFLKKFEAEHTK